VPIGRFKDIPVQPDQPALSEADKNLVVHVALPILGGHVLMGTDAPESMGFTVKQGNNMYINLEPDTRTETDRLFKALAVNGKVEAPLQRDVLGRVFWQPGRPVRRELDVQLHQQDLIEHQRFQPH